MNLRSLFALPLSCCARFFLCALFLLCALGFPSLAQQSPATINVRVTGAEREDPLERAEVRLHVFAHPVPSHRAYTDGSGRVTFYGVERGHYDLEVEKDGYELYRERVDIPGGMSQHISVRLRPKDAPGRRNAGGTVSAAMLAPGPARKAYEEGMAVLREKPAESIAHFRRAIELHAKFPEAWAMLGLAYTREKHFPEARAALQQAIELNPRDTTPQVLLGKLYMEEKDFAKAEKQLKESLHLDSQAWDIPYELSRCYFNLGKLALALEFARKAQALPQAPTTTHLLLADIFLRRGESSNALHELEEFAKKDPQSPFIERVRARIAQLKKAPVP